MIYHRHLSVRPIRTSPNSQLGHLKQNFTQAILKLILSYWFSKIMLLAALKIGFKFSGKCFQAICLCFSDTDENGEASKNTFFRIMKAILQIDSNTAGFAANVFGRFALGATLCNVQPYNEHKKDDLYLCRSTRGEYI